MFLDTSGVLFRCVACLALALWGVSAHHDALLELAEWDHCHVSHVADNHSGSHHGDHSHTHSDDSEKDHRDSIPLPDCQADSIIPSTAKAVVDSPKTAADVGFWLFATLDFLFSGSFGSDVENPPQVEELDLDPPVLILLAHSVQSNAPPVLS